MFNAKMIVYSLIVAMIGFFAVQANASHVDVLGEEEITGVVVDASTDEALEGVEISLERGDQSAESNAEGHFSIENVEPGTYTLVAEAEGYEQWSQDIEVTEYGTEVEIRLQPAE